jgi:hypothetical protein
MLSPTDTTAASTTFHAKYLSFPLPYFKSLQAIVKLLQIVAQSCNALQLTTNASIAGLKNGSDTNFSKTFFWNV